LRAGALLACAALLLASAVTASGANRPLRTAVFDPGLQPADWSVAANRIHAAGATLVRITANWTEIAPATRSASFRPTNPADPEYRWSVLDGEVRALVKNGVEPIVDVVGMPAWARAPASTGVGYPQAVELGRFAQAIATHYDGRTRGVPRARYWMLWNEPNLNTQLEPQFDGLRPVSPGIYRGMVNAFTKAVKGVSPSNVAIVGALAPYGIQKAGQPIDDVLSVAPLRFMRELLCISAGPKPRATCNTKVAFDAFSVHPYTWGDPTHHAFSSDDLAMGDLPDAKKLLADAWRLHRISARSAPELWVTEFSWDSNPPDPTALPSAIQTRWTSEALYRMWSDGVAVCTWWLLRDMPMDTSPFQSGLYLAGPTIAQDTPKPTLTAFRFPFVAFPEAKGTLVWGRVPRSDPRNVVIEQQDGAGWKRLASLRSDRNGIFEQVLPLHATDGYLRARLGDGSARSLPFGLKAVPDERVSPWGGPA
jgi:hypothetical protein